MTIGRFAQLSGLTVKALRYYDETGLLPPARVDPDTGYRWYRPGQARRAATISALRSAGLPLELVRRAVLEELERAGGGAGTIRQTPLLDEQGRFRGLEISVALEPRAA